MEVADALYGVTMRSGVTEVISQRLRTDDEELTSSPRRSPSLPSIYPYLPSIMGISGAGSISARPDVAHCLDAQLHDRRR